MTVKELINELKKCNPDDIVMYNPENAIKNQNDDENDGTLPEVFEDYGVDDVLICSGTERGFVLLTEELYETVLSADTTQENKMKDKIRESQKTVSEIIEEVKAEICDDYCRYSNGEGHPSECGTFEECENCPFTEMG